MIYPEGKISTRQTFIVFFLLTATAAVRLFPQVAAKLAGTKGWLAPIVSIIPAILLIFMLHGFFKNNKKASLDDIFTKVLGKAIGKVVVSLYLVWILVLLALYIRYYAERIVSSIMSDTSMSFLIISILILAFFAVRNGIVPIARMVELFFIFLLTTCLIIFVLQLPQVRFENILNISYKDIWPIIKSSYAVAPIWGYITFAFFLGNGINDKENIKKFGYQWLVLVSLFSLLILIVTIGVSGADVTSNMTLPFFSTVRNISLFDSINHVESIVVSIWIISDFTIITVFIYICSYIIKKLFSLSSSRPFVGPVTLLAGIGSMFLFGSRFELEVFSIRVGLLFNSIFEYIIPAIVFGIGKLRKVI